MEMAPRRNVGLEGIAVLLCQGADFRLTAANRAAYALLPSVPIGAAVADVGWRPVPGWPDLRDCQSGASTRMSLGQQTVLVTRDDLSDGGTCLLVESLLLDADAELARAVDWLEAVEEPVLLLDDGGTVIFATSHAEREHGYETGGLIGRHLLELHQPRRGGGPAFSSDAADLVRELRHLAVLGVPRRFHVWHRRRDGARFPGTVFLRPRQVGGRSMILARARDEASHQGRIDDLERALAVKDRADRVKSKVLTTAGHDLRTPLTAILGFCDLLLLDYDEADGEPGRSLDRIRSSAHVLDRQFSRVIEFFKLEDDRLDVEFTLAEPCALVRAACERWAGHAAGKGIRLRQHLEDGVERCRVRTDPRRLAAALDEYLDNALRVTVRGCVEVQALRRADRIEFRVEDAGPGVSQHDRDDLFTAFTDQGELRPRSTMGIGIGLHMVRRLAQLLGAEAGLVSSSADGSTFALALPLAEGAS